MLTDEDIALLGGKYEGVRPRFERVAGEVNRVVTEALRRRAVKHMTTSRAKWRDSLVRKLLMDREQHAYADFGPDLVPALRDLAGVRVLLYVPKDVEPAVAAVRQAFAGCGDRWPAKSIAKPEGYRAEHVYVDLLSVHDEVHAQFGDVRHLPCEVQICTITSHIWNELEHDIVYKQPSGLPDDGQRELLRSLHQELALATATVGRLMDRTDERARKNGEGLKDPADLRRYLEIRFRKTLKGDFASLLELLGLLIDDVAPRTVDRLFEVGVSKERAMEVTGLLDLDQAHGDVGWIAVMLLRGLNPKNVVDVVDSASDLTPLWKFLRRAADQGDP